MPVLPPPDPRKPLDGLTRRTLLKASCGLAATGVLAGAAAVTWRDVVHHAATNPLADGTPVLVLVTMYGGNDGINTVVPYADPAYHAARPDLAYTDAEVLPLADGLGLSPGMTGLHALWQSQQLAVVRGVGYPKPDHSHFRSMDIWQTASPDTPVSSGWVGRWLDGAGDDPLLALNLGDVLPPLAVGQQATAAALSLQAAPKGAPDGSVLDHFAADDPRDGAAARQVVASYAAARTVRSALAPVTDAVDPQAASSKGADGLSAQLDLVARCLAMGAPTRVYSVSLSGFDTHADEKATQSAQLGLLDQALTRFRQSLATTGRAKDVVVMAYSEFGRRVRANASEGTDHGTAGPVLVMGEGVRGGFVGDQPSLTDLDAGDLKVTTDFRSVYADVLRSVLGADPQRVLGQDPAPLGLFA
ncbi:DUF1501 domain-containing protein [Lapillicoccus jejuensis]|uniref:Uncharacterized protein (DUF1501 family) n=1 Tax=Lapillicoccus jejuensis TaxID=402171 RepID=A0A542E6P2_9MICO|nr:DUF1501 domain-containing protein [Lapillicoccus jejuensis]TQJ11002.1 uncharacterized protein (DUF1501 family) [Lapillicoccus jejuensis]